MSAGDGSVLDCLLQDVVEEPFAGAVVRERAGSSVDMQLEKENRHAPTHPHNSRDTQGRPPSGGIPLATQHYMLLQLNLIYTGITRGKRLLVLIGQKKALGIAVRNDRPQRRYSGLLASLRGRERHRDFIK